MIKNVKRVLSFIAVLLLITALVSCDMIESSTPRVEYTVTFKLDNGKPDVIVKVRAGRKVSEPKSPTKSGFEFSHWYIDDIEEPVNFKTLVVDKNLIITAYYDVLPDGTLALIEEDILSVSTIFDELEDGAFLLDLPKSAENGSRITWSTDSPYVSTTTGLMMPARSGDNETEATLVGTFSLSGKRIVEEFVVILPVREVIDLTETKTVSFVNLTTEYDVADRSVNLHFNEDGSVPYIKVVEFFELLHGFIDPELEIIYTTSDGVLTVAYDYYSESQDHTFHLTAVIDTINQTITTEDPGFYSAYVYSTETNYGRHIEYDTDNENASYKEGTDLVLHLGDYNLAALLYDGDVVIPYALANQLFAGASYYNVYYNGDNLYGVYSLPGPEDDEFQIMKNSSKNNSDFEYDMFLITYDMLAFNFDYFYGLKDIMEIETYYNILEKNKNTLLTLNPLDFDTALFKMINKDIDELHTSFDAPSHYNKRPMPTLEVQYVEEFGRRVSGWYNNGVFEIQRSLANAFPAGSQPDYWTVDNKTAVVTLDGFRTLDIEESSSYDELLTNKILKANNILPEINSGDKFFFINTSTTEHRVLNILVKNTEEGYVSTYANDLLASGFSKEAGTNYYTLKENQVDYTLHLSYSEETKLLTVSIVDRSYAQESLKPLIMTDDYDYVYRDSALYLEIILEQLFEEHPEIENILLDIAYNTGGNVGALYRVVGFITGEPFQVTSLSPDTNSASTSFVYIDGVPLYDHINWGLLASTVSFSAANSLATIFKENNLGPIIGTKTGGGAASITPILLPNGTSFIMSSNNVSGYRTGLGTEEDPYVYHDNEFGIEPDIVLRNLTFYNRTGLERAVDEAFYS